MKFLDSNILAYAFYENPHMAKCQNAIKEGGVTDTFALAEAFLIIEKETGQRELAIKAIRGLLKSNLSIREINTSVIFDALRITHQTKLRIFDALHYACALLNNCTSILSYDKDLESLKLKRNEPSNPSPRAFRYP